MEPEVNRHGPSMYSGISKRMIDQFFTEVEGPDRDWQSDDFDYFDDERDELTV
jgi:hypothetical protein